jgi:peroxiredoxin
MRHKNVICSIICLVLTSLFILVSLWGEDKYQIRLRTNSMGVSNDPPVIFSVYDPIGRTKNQVASVNLEEDTWTEINFAYKQPNLYVLDVTGHPPLYLAIDEGQKMIEISLKKGRPVQIKGSPDSSKLLAYEEFRKESNQTLIRPTYEAMTKASKQQNQEGEVAAVEAYVKASKQHRKELIDFTEREIGDSIALFGTSLRWTGDDEVSRLDALVAAFSKRYPNLPMTTAMKEKVARFKRVAIGASAPNLQGQDPDGADITLYQSLGKYTLIDFWAAWCRPCLLQIPDLKKTYADFHSKGFEIFGYSLDDREAVWKSALDKYDMPWKHASDIKGWKSEWAKEYNVTFIPFNFLVDEKGVIVAKNLHHKTLSKKLSQLFDTQ